MKVSRSTIAPAHCRVLLAAAIVLLAVPARTQEESSNAFLGNLRAVASAGRAVTLVGGDRGMIFRSTDDGATWSTVYAPAGEDRRSIESIAFCDAQRAVAVGGGGLALASADGGQHWAVSDARTRANLVALAVVPGGAGHAWAVGSDGNILRTSDAGASWSHQETATVAQLNGVAFANDSTGWVCGAQSVLLRTTDGGRRWTPVETGVHASFQALAFPRAAVGWVVGGYGAILRTGDGGRTWHAQNTKKDYVGFRNGELLTAAAFPDTLHGLLLGTGSVILRTADGGRSFSEQQLPTQEVVVDLAFADPKLGWIVGYQGALLRTTNGGKSWTALRARPHP